MNVTYYDNWSTSRVRLEIDDSAREYEELCGAAQHASFFLVREFIQADNVDRILDKGARCLQRSVESGGAMDPDSVDQFPTLWHYFFQHGRYLGEASSTNYFLQWDALSSTVARGLDQMFASAIVFFAGIWSRSEGSLLRISTTMRL